MGNDTWRSQAACRGKSTQNYDPWSPPDKIYLPPKVAVEVCDRCPVKRDCLRAGLDGGEWGVWGGTTRRQRMTLKRSRNRERCPLCKTKLIVPDEHFEVCTSCGTSWKRSPDVDALRPVRRDVRHGNVDPRRR